MTYHILAMTYTWWHGDDLPPLPPSPDFRCEPVVDVPLLAKLHKVDVTKIEERLADANTTYLAFLKDEPVGYGWSGANSVGVAEYFLADDAAQPWSVGFFHAGIGPWTRRLPAPAPGDPAPGAK